MKTIQVIPAANRLVQSLRDLGYDFPQAVADLVDNSITARAGRIAVDLRFHGPDSWLRVTDDGHGMTPAEITEAMRYGASQAYKDEDLGKFGLGLKTASLSQCRRVTVASRRGRQRARIGVRVLDLDHVAATNRWEVLAPSPRTVDKRFTETLERAPGTVVLWESLDRILGYKIPWGKRARSALDALAEQLSLHLGMVFHRFLSGEVAGRGRIRILVNGRRVPAWDPFAREEPATRALPGCDLDVETADGAGLVAFQPWVLPPRNRFSSEEAFHRCAGPRRWNAQQGLYIYRANRMIQSGGWCRLRAPDEHLKLARASLDFFPELDSAFEVNVAKVRAVLPANLRERLKSPVEALVRAAQSAYREQETPRESTGRRSRVNGRPVPRTALEKAARRAGASTAWRRIVTELRGSEPQLAESLGH